MQNKLRLIQQLSSDGAKESEGARAESILFHNPDSTDPLVDYRPSVLVQVPDIRWRTHSSQHSHTRVNLTQDAAKPEMPREPLISETGSDTHTADDGVMSANDTRDWS